MYFLKPGRNLENLKKNLVKTSGNPDRPKFADHNLCSLQLQDILKPINKYKKIKTD